MKSREFTRRSVLLAGAGGAGAVIAACSSGGAPAADNGFRGRELGRHRARVSRRHRGGRAASVKLPGGGPGVVSRLSTSQAACFSAVCPHLGCTVAPTDSAFSCPCHGSQFDLRTGAVRQGPATSGLTKVAVSVSGGRVVAT
jgi:Rieske Fe-S protein